MTTGDSARRGAHICLSGVDGVGKSTQAGWLAKYIRDQGHFCYLQEGKEEFCVNVARQLACETGVPPRQLFGLEEFEIAKAFDTLRDYAQTVLPIVTRGGFVVSPRASFDRVALAISMGSQKASLIERISEYYGSPDLIVYLRSPLEVSMARIQKRGFDDEDLEVMRRFKAALDDMAERRGWPSVDATGEPRAIFEQVRQVVDTHLKRPASADLAGGRE